MAKKKEDTLILETMKPGAELAEVPPTADWIQQWLAEDANVHTMTAEMLKAEGVEYVFGLLSACTLQAEMEWQKHGIKRVHVRREDTGTFAAEGWARLAGRPGVGYFGPGTGTTNATTGAVQGLSAAAPAVFLAYTSFAFDDTMNMAQGISRAYKMYNGITKYTHRLVNFMTLPFELKRAFRSCMTPPTGPVCPELSAEVSMDMFRHGPRINYLVGFNPLTWSGRSDIPKRPADPQIVEENGRGVEMRGVVTDYRENQVLAMHLVGKYNNIDVEYRLEEIEGRTRLTMSSNIQFGSFLKILSIILWPAFKKKLLGQLNREYARLKELCERDT